MLAPWSVLSCPASVLQFALAETKANNFTGLKKPDSTSVLIQLITNY